MKVKSQKRIIVAEKILRVQRFKRNIKNLIPVKPNKKKQKTILRSCVGLR